MTNRSDNNSSFLKRFYIYQMERFPFLAHGIMIGAFTFSAISYSLISRGQESFIPWQDFIIGVFVTLTLFLLVRIFDEFKDHEDDVKYRKYLPVPRGLISLKELKTVGILVALLQIGLLLVFQPKMIGLYFVVIGYLCLMGVEFFVPNWLRERQLFYITSHMFIIPLIDLYASGLDWLLSESAPHYGLLWFFCVSYSNGLVLEFGRKIRTPDTEEDGVVSYTKLYGTQGGTLIWLGTLFLTMLLAVSAAYYANYGFFAYVYFAILFVICSLPGWLFLNRATAKKTKLIEYSSALWTVLMYLSLGAIPMLTRFIE